MRIFQIPILLLLFSCSNQDTPSNNEIPTKQEAKPIPVEDNGPEITNFMEFNKSTTKSEVINYFSKRDIKVDLNPNIHRYTNGRAYLMEFSECSDYIVVSAFNFLNMDLKNVAFQFDGEILSAISFFEDHKLHNGNVKELHDLYKIKYGATLRQDVDSSKLYSYQNKKDNITAQFQYVHINAGKINEESPYSLFRIKFPSNQTVMYRCADLIREKDRKLQLEEKRRQDSIDQELEAI